MDINFRERFLALQRLEMADASYTCERKVVGRTRTRAIAHGRPLTAGRKTRKPARTLRSSAGCGAEA